MGAFACVVATINETGTVTAVRVVESSSPSFADYLVNLVKNTRFHPAAVGGKPFVHQTVIAAGLS
jgi:TonB family protein